MTTATGYHHHHHITQRQQKGLETRLRLEPFCTAHHHHTTWTATAIHQRPHATATDNDHGHHTTHRSAQRWRKGLETQTRLEPLVCSFFTFLLYTDIELRLHRLCADHHRPPPPCVASNDDKRARDADTSRAFKLVCSFLHPIYYTNINLRLHRLCRPPLWLPSTTTTTTAASMCITKTPVAPRQHEDAKCEYIGSSVTVRLLTHE